MGQKGNEFAEIVEILAGVKKHIETILTNPEHQHHMLKLTSDLQRNIEYISLITGIGDVTPQVTTRLQPATTIAGQPIRFTGKKKEFDVTPEESAVTNLQERVNLIYPSFISMDSKDIRKNVDDIVIRGVAKRAKLAGVTKDIPAVIDIAFIDQIKVRIAGDEQFKKEQADLKESKEPLAEWIEPGDGFDEAFKEAGSGPDDVPDAIGDIEDMQEEIQKDKETFNKTGVVSPTKAKTGKAK